MGMQDFLTKRAEQAAAKVEQAKKNLDDKLDEMVLGIISVYKAQEAIAKKLNIELPAPLVKMEVEQWKQSWVLNFPAGINYIQKLLFFFHYLQR